MFTGGQTCHEFVTLKKLDSRKFEELFNNSKFVVDQATHDGDAYDLILRKGHSFFLINRHKCENPEDGFWYECHEVPSDEYLKRQTLVTTHTPSPQH